MISYQETGALLGLAAARDQRTVGEADVLAWHEDLTAADIDYDDAKQALSRFYVEMAAREPRDRYRASSTDIIALVRKLRTERLTGFVYEPPAGSEETPAQYLTNLRRQIADTASGRTPPAASPPAVEGGPAPAVASALASVGQQVPEEAQPPPSRRPGAKTIRCPKCDAPVGRRCRTPGGKERADHPTRQQAAHHAALPTREDVTPQ